MKLLRLWVLLFALFCTNLQAFGQTPKRWTSGDIHLAIKKLNVLGSALYIAAHPDDENTSIISYLSNNDQARTAYLSLTRGDGGQNLIGPEIRELLGVIRTQELLAARRIDGGEQLFTRANDFGFSKHPDETLEIWQKEEVLADVVWAIRTFRPDIVINRFDHNSAGRTHGHHTASAILSVEAFDLAGDPNAFPEQLKYVEPWQPRRLFFNTSWWFYGSQEKFDAADKSKMISVDVGTYYPVLGKSNTEIAAASRSQHRCQGMGRPLSRGSDISYLELLKGDMPGSKDNLFEGIDIGWSRISGGAPIEQALKAIEKGFRYDNPAASVPALLGVYRKIKALPDNHWKSIKLEETKEVIQACLALFVEATVSERTATPGQTIEVELELVNRSSIEAELLGIHFKGAKKDTTLGLNLPENETQKIFQRVQIPKDAPYTSPYWLNAPADLGMYTVEDQKLRGLPETPRFLRVVFDLAIGSEKLQIEKDVLFKGSDRVEGETYQPFDILPPVFAGTTNSVYIFANQAPKTVGVKVRAGADKVKGTVALSIPDNWQVEPARQDFELALKDAEQQLEFKLYPPEEQSVGTILPVVEVDGKTYSNDLISIEYDHIPIQSVLRPGEARVVKVDLQKAGDRIGYIMGAGDEIPTSLEQVGYQVDILEDAEITPGNLAPYDAVILGIRAYNTVDRMKFHQPILLDYVKNGGTMIVQYNTTWQMEFPMEQIAPYPLKLSRERVTVEDAPVRLLLPDHPVLNTPNKITEQDFDGWVQERGLYFPEEWDPQFQAILSCNDPGESPKDGGLLVAPYGKGYYIYTGYSWFRELPAGVPGAYRLFTNLISLGKKAQP